ncbi:hypothetical protein QAD02_009465 [Eretmocerus hayati]|uniref:Uncharacterized protein n=1 Tax=Eretmocerus hayati TaxID=131215 RepID=A0ACC2N9F5_9HYME|nr:hypothetical protein QAD02_009465 [Eretmocerus hayati]
MRARGGINLSQFVSIFFSLIIVVIAVRDDYVGDERPGSEESSDTYLRNVVSELQFLNGVAPSVEAPHRHQEASVVVTLADPIHQQQKLMEQRLVERNRAAQYNLQKYARPQLPASDSSYVDQDVGESIPVSHYHPQTPITAQAPNVLGMSASELAAMYKAALDRGNPVRYSSLMANGGAPPPQQLQHQRQLTKLILQPEQPQAALVYAGAGARQPPTQTARPGYAYYFYPLDSFRHELTDPYGYKTLPSINYDLAPAAATTVQKESSSIMSPIFKAISSFVGMIVAFMLSLFLYPRFMQYLHLPLVTATSRAAIQNELTHLVAFVTEAIDYYNKNLRKKSRHPSQTLKRSR